MKGRNITHPLYYLPPWCRIMVSLIVKYIALCIKLHMVL